MKHLRSKTLFLLTAIFLAGQAQAVYFITARTDGLVQDNFLGASIHMSYDSRTGLVVDTDVSAAEGSFVTYHPLVAATGATAITLDHELAGIRNASSDAIVSGDLATGKIRSFAASGGDLDRFTGGATATYMRLYDTLHFNVQGVSGSVTLHGHVDGVITLQPAPFNGDDNWTDSVQFGSSQYVFNAANNGATSNYGFFDGFGNPTILGWDSFRTSSESLTGFDFIGTFTVHNGDSRTFDTIFSINRCYTHALCDFLNTASFTLDLSSNVSYTSDSGVFLTAVAPPAPNAVPEPGTAAMMFAGLGAMGWVGRRRRGSASLS